MSTQSGTYFLGTYGFPIKIVTGADLTNASACNITIKKPSGASATRDLGTIAVTNPSGGEVTFSPQQAEVDQSGVYTFSIVVDVAGGRRAVGDGSFAIAPNLDSTGNLVVEDGTGLVNANSFGSLAEANAYHAGGLYSDEWTSATQKKRETALIMASRVISYTYDWNGYKKTVEQALEWPRVGATRRSFEPDWRDAAVMLSSNMPIGVCGPYWPSDSVPKGVKEATFEQALDLMRTDRTRESSSKGITSFSLGQGAISVDFDKSDRAQTLSEQVEMMLAPFGQSRANRSSVRIVA